MRGVSIDKVTESFARIIKRKLKGHVKKVILFGSRARGTATKDSDYDILVIVDNREKNVQEVVLDAGVEMLNRYDALIGCVLFDETQWEREKPFPLGLNISEEGIEL